MKITKGNEAQWADAIIKGKYHTQKKSFDSSDKLSCSLWRLAPGKKSFPLHVHHVTEEAMYVISGAAKVRTASTETPIGPGDYVHFSAGGQAHQLINDGTEPLVFLAMSSSSGVDIVDYPDTGKVALAVGKYPSGRRAIFNASTHVEYFDGDEDAK